ncbi:MAG: zinc-binding dehydrogenase [Chthoniobacteraceae bacterium]
MTTNAPRSLASATMNAAVLTRPGSIEIARAEIPRPGPDEVRVRVEGCGVCASNLGPWSGAPWFEYPFNAGAPGHEGYGRIDALGEKVSGWEEGERVAMLSYRAYAEYDVAPVSALVRLPAELDAEPFPAEPLGCAMNIFARSGITPGAMVAVVGIGFLGALLTQLAMRAGAQVIALSRRKWALDLARRMGAGEAVAFGDVERVKEITSGRLCNVVIEAVGKQSALDLATELTAERGRLVVAGYHQDGMRQVKMQLWNWRGLDVINAHERDPQVYVRGMRAAVEAVCDGRLDPAPLYTHRLPLVQLATGLDLTRDRPDGFMKAIVTP